MQGSRFFQRGPNLTVFFLYLVDKSTFAHQRNAIEMAFCWWADDCPTLNAGLVALWFFMGSGPVLQRNPIFCDF